MADGYANIDNLQEEKGRKGAKTIKARWLRRMKLTPCVVMTSFMLPHHMLIREHVSGKKYDNGYLYNFADLLIVDEAGQVLPEVAAASFALAKKALVNGGSRYNDFEARTIAAWLAAHKEEIEHHYSKPLHELVGIVTPFSAQVSAIKSSLLKLDINCSGDENSLTVGTVHSLQGAERAIVLFSPVYSKHEDGGFIDRDSSMLNVAVSRAKDSFLVFGDMDLFEIQPASSPRGLLSKYLFASDNNALQFEYKERQDLNTAQTQISTLHGVEEHDVFLNQTFDAIGKSITIVSPWLTWEKLEQTGFLTSMIQARARGIDITVVTDKSFNTQDVSYEKRKAKQQRLNDAVEKLNALGIVTMLVKRVHSKIVIGDEGLLCIGSFNWFSATRDEKYKRYDTIRYDTSMVYRGESLQAEIKTIYSSLEQRKL